MPPQKDRPKKDRPLAPKELKFVAFYEGNQVKAAQKAGYKFPKAVASAVFNRPQVRAAIKKQALRPYTKSLKVVMAKLGDDAVVMGAAALAADYVGQRN